MVDERPSKVGFEIRVGRQPDTADPLPDTPFCIALLGDFSARANRGILETGRDLAGRKIHRVDRDNLDEAMASLAPELTLSLGREADAGVHLGFSQLEDFHPDSLYQRLPVFDALRDVRARIADPATSADAVRDILGADQASRETHQAAPENLLERILDESPDAAPDAQAALSGDLKSTIKRIVTPHLLNEVDPRGPELLQRIDAAGAALMRALLHHPRLQALEALWRSVDTLVRRIETTPQLQLHLIDVSKEELTADQNLDTELQESGLYRLLVESTVETPGAQPWAVIAGGYSFGPTPDDLLLFARLGALASLAGAPWISEAHPHLVGCDSFGSTPDPADWWPRENALWEALRHEPQARYLGLALPRLLLRLPYGEETEPCETFPFDEIPGSPAHEDYLWGNPAFACAGLLARSYSSAGWSLSPGMHLDIGNLPLHLYREDGDAVAKPCAEALLTDRTAEALLEHGLMPIASRKDTDSVRLIRFQSIAEPLASLSGRWMG
jgi:type VI secretion system protein ImpC